ncbi:GNAT family N-acetyltransferase [Aureimonas pseudogalii]|jgi:GNAT superfamily N-acetyltransferase|uniref:GNAT superfamily N-acetyltransferase n=1 Tax=Aureimonas pseudogalii TaxID=1744844 RepID=A0A7W6MLM3_9HYPH|nr:GNAT family N-acetyltransferase [Aureimonas pseudogalii]MBB3999925.1 GNAT superfamily N-acetyltransferase [Aureimonas pseudogalii]
MSLPATVPDIEIGALRLRDARELAPLLAAYNQAMFRGAPGAPDTYYAEQLLQDRTGEILGARLNGELVAFLVFYDLPDPWTGMRAGLADHVFVDQRHRRKGIAKAMVDLLADEADARGWSRLVLHAPRNGGSGRHLYEKVAGPADWSSYVIRFIDR